MATPSTPKPRDTLLILGVLVLIIACLYWARQILVPVALAVLLAFILTPAVSRLQRRGLGRLPSVLLVVLLALLLLGGAGYIISRQLNTILGNVQKYQAVIVQKIEDLRGMGQGGVLSQVESMTQELSSKEAAKAIKKGAQEKEPKTASESGEGVAAGSDTRHTPGAEPSNPLYVQMAPSGWTRAMEAVGPAAEGLGEAFLVLVMVVFMLIQRENLRNRLVRLIGHGRLIVTTQAFDESAQRISRFLLMQMLINLFFGVTLAVGLFTSGVLLGYRELWEYALFWGFVAFVLRFVPYLGTWLAAALVVGYCVATLPGWYLPLGVFAFFLVIELLTANVVEPLLFGHSTGVSPLALLLAAAFWTWLWGPVGLILSTPLTVILVILGKYVPELHFFEVLLGDEPVLSTDVTFYQRLVARDLDEASDLVEDYLRDHEPGEVYEDVLLPALLHAKRDHERGELEPDNYDFVLQGIRDVEEDLAAAIDEHFKEADGAKKAVAIGCPGRDEADELSLVMLGQLLRLAGYSLEVVSSKKLTGEVLKQLETAHPVLVCIGSLAPGGLSQARYLCKRLRQQHADLKILVGRWGDKANLERTEKRLRAAGADQVATTLHASRDEIIPLLQVVVNAEPKPSELITTP